MKTTFTPQYIMDNKGCYDEDQVKALKCYFKEIITIKDLFDELPLNDFFWFLIRKCDLATDQQKKISLECAKIVLPIYEEKFPNEDRVRNCIEVTEKYLNGQASLEELHSARNAAAVADAVAAADADAAVAAAAKNYPKILQQLKDYTLKLIDS